MLMGKSGIKVDQAQLTLPSPYSPVASLLNCIEPLFPISNDELAAVYYLFCRGRELACIKIPILSVQNGKSSDVT